MQDKDISNIINQCLQKDPNQRPSLNEIRILMIQKEECIKNQIQSTSAYSFQAKFSLDEDDSPEEKKGSVILDVSENKIKKNWEVKFCKIINNSLYIFRSKTHKKAEKLYELWKCKLQVNS